MDILSRMVTNFMEVGWCSGFIFGGHDRDTLDTSYHCFVMILFYCVGKVSIYEPIRLFSFSFEVVSGMRVNLSRSSCDYRRY